MVDQSNTGNPLSLPAWSGVIDAPAISGDQRMSELLDRFPGARRALFAAFHIGGCQSCAYRPEETLAEVCTRHELDLDEAIATLRESHVHDQQMLISPAALQKKLSSGEALQLVDCRTREEHEAVSIEDSRFLTQELQQELFATPPEELIVLYDHRGRDVLDQCAWFHGHGLRNTRGLEGGIDAWSREVDSSVPRYRLEMD